MADENSIRVLISARAFEWDENKRLSNIEKHGIDFADAIEVFDDLYLCLRRSRSAGDEERFVSIGMLRDRLIAVVCTPRDGKIRTISAQTARRSEREQYEQQKETGKK